MTLLVFPSDGRICSCSQWQNDAITISIYMIAIDRGKSQPHRTRACIRVVVCCHRNNRQRRSVLHRTMSPPERAVHALSFAFLFCVRIQFLRFIWHLPILARVLTWALIFHCSVRCTAVSLMLSRCLYCRIMLLLAAGFVVQQQRLTTTSTLKMTIKMNILPSF